MLYPGLQVDFAEVKCSLPVSPVNLRQYDNVGVTAAGLKIAVSNNRINVSKNSELFITYDSVCQECNTSIGCRLKVSISLFFIAASTTFQSSAYTDVLGQTLAEPVLTLVQFVNC